MLTHCENNFDVKENQKLDKNQGILQGQLKLLSLFKMKNIKIYLLSAMGQALCQLFQISKLFSINNIER